MYFMQSYEKLKEQDSILKCFISSKKTSIEIFYSLCLCLAAPRGRVQNLYFIRQRSNFVKTSYFLA